MKNVYDHRELEPRWQRHWETEQTFEAKNPGQPGFDPAQPKYYVLDMFPYPSGSGLHVGHGLGYVATDIVARRKRMQGFNVLHPMGWDAFGLPAEQFAIKTGKHPAETTKENCSTYRQQLKRIGMAYAWSREINTSDPSYYRWTQWIFKRLYERGLAYQAEVPVWWCEELKTVLANEEVINGHSERGNHPCVRRPLKQWMLRITEYAERLLADLDGIDWPESIKAQQREWIGRSEGATVCFPLESGSGDLEVFTTRPDTLWGATFMVLAPEHDLVETLTSLDQRAEVGAYVAQAAKKSELERTDLAKGKSGVFTGSYALNPVMDPSDPKARVPIWIADYVLATYGTGAIMSVPGHDGRDFEFATKFELPIREVVQAPEGQDGLAQGTCFTGHGSAKNSGPIDGLPTAEAKERTIEMLIERGIGEGRVTYKLRDWLFSRQRYWGEPFPLLHRVDGQIVPVGDDALPVELPAMDDFRPAQDGSAPLERAKDWMQTVDPADGSPARRDSDTMPGWAGSCWYWLRYMDPACTSAPFSPEAEAYWGPVDLYVGGASHAVMHLLYARFWHKVLFDAGVVTTSEPFGKLFNQGMVQAFAFRDDSQRMVHQSEVEEDGGKFTRKGTSEPLEQFVTKMAKSLGNVVNPDDIVEEYGADTLRLYEMFMGPVADSKPWNPRDLPGCRRFLERAWRVLVDESGADAVRTSLQEERPLEGATLELEKHLQRAIKRIDDSFEHFNLNTGIAALMSFVNEATKQPKALTRSQARRFVAVLSPFAPHMGEELWSRLGGAKPLATSPWPSVDAAYLEDDDFELVVQVLGKVRGRARAPREAGKEDLERLARETVAGHLEGKQVVKTIVVPGRLVNFVVR